MSEIVAAMATCHAPQLLSRPPDEKPEQLDATIAAMKELGKILDETRPDAIIFLGSDHLETFSQTCVPTFALIAGATAVAEFGGHDYERPIHRALADHLLDGLVRSDFDISYSEDALLGHTYAVPFEYLLEDRDIPIVPFHTNVYMPPLPSTRRCEALGKKIVELLEGRDERVAILASGGMSHYPGTSRYSEPDFDFDWWLIGELEKGNIDALMNMTVEQLDQTGNTELLSWCTLLGAIGAQPGELLQYTPTWHHGHGMMRFLPAREKTLNAHAQSRPPYQFKDGGFEFYVHPPEESFKLNKLLFKARTEAEMRRQIIDEMDKVVAEWELNGSEQRAVQALIDVKDAGTVSDYTVPLVEAGVHPLQALMTLHVIFGDHRRRKKAAEGI